MPGSTPSRVRWRGWRRILWPGASELPMPEQSPTGPAQNVILVGNQSDLVSWHTGPRASWGCGANPAAGNHVAIHVRAGSRGCRMGADWQVFDGAAPASVNINWVSGIDGAGLPALTAPNTLPLWPQTRDLCDTVIRRGSITAAQVGALLALPPVSGLPVYQVATLDPLGGNENVFFHIGMKRLGPDLWLEPGVEFLMFVQQPDYSAYLSGYIQEPGS